VYFSDVGVSRTYKWSLDGKVTLFREDTGSANGLAFDRAHNLLVCESGRGRVTSIAPQGRATVVANQYNAKRFNQPNDLWIDPQGGAYFSDPIYGQAEKRQDGEHVYYVTPDRKRVIRVIADMVRPNGLVGTPDGTMLYVTDHGAKQTYVYVIERDGSLSHKRLFAPVGADGMKLDREGNLYLAEKDILVYDSAGKHLETIEIPEQPTNLCFAGPDGHTLFVTARSAVYTLQMRVAGAHLSQQPEARQ
jgi:gluconolactonase